MCYVQRATLNVLYMTDTISKSTGIISSEIYLDHQTGGHPESPRRAEALYGLAGKLLAGPGRFVGLAPVKAELSQIEAVHTPRYVAALQRFCRSGGGPIDRDTLVSPASFDVALLAAGGLLRGVDAVMAGEVSNAFALVRPPGHHAVADASMGFCLFNNIGVATRYLLDNYSLERVLIVDWDVHHGNGTQAMFYDDPRVLFFSSHQYPLYPGTGYLSETGEGRGRGFNLNLPLPPGCGDAVLEKSFEVLLEPLAEKFKPQFILVSAGFDGHWRDPLAGLNLSSAGYARLTGRLLQMAETYCQGRVAMVLEGGYDLMALTGSVEATLRTLAGETPEAASRDDQAGPGPGGYSPELGPLRELLREARQLHGL
jgi:acetoin utilization deacetylase AcuC-like enzyme